jgi:hypothetical protein
VQGNSRFLHCLSINFFNVSTSVADPNPDQPDPHVFGHPGSGSTSQRYGSGSFSGSESFCNHAKIVKTLNPTIFLLLIFEK